MSFHTFVTGTEDWGGLVAEQQLHPPSYVTDAIQRHPYVPAYERSGQGVFPETESYYGYVPKRSLLAAGDSGDYEVPLPATDTATIDQIMRERENLEYVSPEEDATDHMTRMMAYLGMAPARGLLGTSLPSNAQFNNLLSRITKSRLEKLPFYAIISSREWQNQFFSMMRNFFTCVVCGQKNVNEMMNFGKWRCTQKLSVVMRTSARGIHRAGARASQRQPLLTSQDPATHPLRRDFSDGMAFYVRVLADHRPPDIDMWMGNEVGNVSVPKDVYDVLPPLFQPLADASFSDSGSNGKSPHVFFKRVSPSSVRKIDLRGGTHSRFLSNRSMGPSMGGSPAPAALGSSMMSNPAMMLEYGGGMGSMVNDTHAVVRDSVTVVRHDVHTENELRQAAQFSYSMDDLVAAMQDKGYQVTWMDPSRDRNIYTPTFAPPPRMDE